MTRGEQFMSYVSPEPMSGCWLWTGGADQRGYGMFHSDGRTVRAHRVSYLLHRGSIPDGLWVLHRCDVTSCVNPDHLYLGTNADNVADREQRGGKSSECHVRGFQHQNCRVSRESILGIRSLRAAGASIRKVAKRYAVSNRLVLDVIHGRRWADVQ